MRNILRVLSIYIMLFCCQYGVGQEYSYEEVWISGLVNPKYHYGATLKNLNNFTDTLFTIPASISYKGNNHHVYRIQDLGANTTIKSMYIGSNVGNIYQGGVGALTVLKGEIASQAFYNCSALQEFKIGENANFSVINKVLYNKAKNELVAYPYANTSTTFEVPATVTSIRQYSGLDKATHLSSFSVAPNNSSFCEIEGVLFNSQKTTLYYYPAAKTSTTYEIPATVTSIASTAILSEKVTEVWFKGTRIPSLSGSSFLSKIDVTKSILYVSPALYDDFKNNTTWANRFSQIIACDIEKKVNVSTPGTLSNEISSSEKNNITHLIVKGYLNNADILFLREMAGRNQTGGTTSGNLKYLDLKEGGIVTDNNSYYLRTGSLFNYTYYTTKSNIFPTYAFYQCNQLEHIVLPTSVTTIGESALRECKNLHTVEMADCKFTKIENNAFRHCGKIKSFTLPKSVTEIGIDAFVDTKSNREFKIDPTNVKFEVFKGALFTKGLKKILAYPIGLEATSYTIPFGTETIGTCAFSYATLESIKIPYGVTTIEGWAFEYTDNFKELTIPASVNNIQRGVFYNCTTIQHLYLLNPQAVGIDVTDQGLNSNICTIYVPFQTVSDYSSHGYWKNFKLVKLDEAIYVDKSQNYSLEKTLEIKHINPTNVSELIITGQLDSDDIRFLRKLAGVDEFGNSIEGYSLKYIDLSGATIQKGGNAYLSANGITGITRDNDLGFSAFANSNIETFIFPETIEAIDSETFRNCKNLYSVTINRLPKNMDINSSEIQKLIGNPNSMVIIKDENLTNEPIDNANIIVTHNYNSRVKLEDKFNYVSDVTLLVGECSFTKHFSKRTLQGKSIGWETIILPFVPTEIWGTNKLGQTVRLLPFGSNEEGLLDVKNFWLRKLSTESENGMESIPLEGMKPNTPYLIAMPNDSEHFYDAYNIVGDVTFVAKTDGYSPIELQETKVPEIIEGKNYKLGATYRNLTNQTTQYVLNETGDAFVRVDVDRETLGNIYAFEAFAILPAGSQSVKRFNLDERPGIPSGLEAVMLKNYKGEKDFVVTTTSNGIRLVSKVDKPIIIRTIDGRIVATEYIYEGENFISLPKGIYLIDREKVVVY